MKPLPDVVAGQGRLGQPGRAVAVGGAGAVWGLGLARLLAEGGLRTHFYTSPLVVAATATVCAGLTLALWWLSSSVSASSGVEGAVSSLPLALPLLYVVGGVRDPLAGAALLVGGAGLALLMAWRDRPSWSLPALLGLATLSLYVRTLLPSVGEADTLEFQVVAAKLGVAHPTGYPLYVLLGKLFTLLPLKSVAWRVNLTSAVFGAAAVVVVFALVRRVTGSSRPGVSHFRGPVAFLAALALAFSATFWSQAVAAEVYTLHNLLVAAILALLLRQLEPSEGRDAERARRWRAILFLLGLSMTNHLTTVLTVPALGLTLLSSWLRDRAPLRARDWVSAVGFFLLGLSLYVFIPLRWPALHDGRWMTMGEFLRYVTGGQFHGALSLDGWRDPTRWRIVGRLLQQPLGWTGLALAGLGVARLAICHRRALMVTGVTFLAFFAYGLLYSVPDIAVFLLPGHMILTVWMGMGVASLGELLTARAPLAHDVWSAILVALFALVPLSAMWTNLPAVDRSQDRGACAWGRYTLDQPLETGGAILADTKKFAPLYYLQQVEGLRPDLDIVLLGSEELYQADLRRRVGEGQAVYLARYLPGLSDLYLRSVGPLVEVRPPLLVHAGADPPPVHAHQGSPDPGFARRRSPPNGVSDGDLAIPFERKLKGDSRRAALASSEGGQGSGRLLGADTGGDRPRPASPQRGDGPIQLLDAEVERDPLGRALRHVTLHWWAETSIDDDLVVRLRLVDANGEARWASEGQRPVNGLYPTNAWPPEVPISDYHEVPIEPWLPPGRYSLQVGLFSPFGDEGLASDAGSSPWVSLGAVDVALRSGAKSLPSDRLLNLGGGTWLTGMGVPEEGTAGSPLTVDLSWRGVVEDEDVRLRWSSRRRRRPDSTPSPRAADYDFLLPAGMVRSRHVVTAPGDPGVYTLQVGLLDQPARCSWLAPPEESCSLTSVRIVADQEGLANFADRLLLLEAKVGKDEATPGELIPVALRWRGLRPMGVDYTVFVHLVGPDGRLHGQVDSWPVQGTHPTSQWRPGKGVLDSYEVRLLPDGPAGRYRVEVGLYDLETMERLRVLDRAGKPVADSFVVATFDVRE